MRYLVPSLLSVPFLLLTLGCSGGGSNPTPASQCNDLVHNGSTLTLALASNPPPDPAGGTLHDGDYVLTAARLFRVPNDVDVERKLGISLKVKGDVIERVSHIDGQVERHSFTYTIDGTKLSLNDTCSSSGTQTHGFSATATELELIMDEPGTPYTMNQVFTKS
jgi:hypothetical protein